MRIVLAIMMTCALWSVAATSAAQSDAEIERFDRLVAQGQSAYEAGDYAQALDAFEDAETIFAHPKLSARIVEAQVQLGQCSAASQRLGELDGEDTSERLDQLRGAVSTCRARGRLLVECVPTSATVEVGQQSVVCGEPARLAVGDHRLVARAQGYEDHAQRVSVAEAELSRVRVALQPARDEPVDSGGSSTMRLIGWSGVGVGAAMLAGGLWVDSGAADRQDELRRASNAGNFKHVRRLEDEASAKRGLTAGLLIGGALVAAGGASALVYDTYADSDEANRVRLGIGIDRVSVSFDW